MESGRFFFDPSACHGNMTFLGNHDSIFREVRSGMNMEETSNKRLFFSSPMNLFDEEYYDEQLPEKKRRLTVEQVHLLEKSFEEENKLEPERKNQLAKKLGLQPRQVAVWFQNRRSRWKTKQLEMDYDLLKSSYESLRYTYESTLKETDKLKSEVNSLNEKLQEKANKATTPDQKETRPLTEVFFPKEPSSVHLNMKVDDRLSSGSASSAVVDEDAPQLVDSCDSYFPNHDSPGGFLGCIPERILEEDDGTDGQGYPDVFAAVHLTQQNQETLGWWVWS